MPNLKQPLIRALSYVFLPLALLSSFVSAAEKMTVNYPNNIEMIAVNGKLTDAPKSVSLFINTNKIKPMQLAFQLNTFYNARGNREKFTSDLLIATFTPPHAGQYQLTVADVRSAKTQKQFNQNPHISLKDNQGNTIALKTHQLRKNGLQIGRDFDAELSSFNRTNHPAAVLAFVIVPLNSLPNNQPINVVSASTATVQLAAATSTLTSPVVGMSVIRKPQPQQPAPQVKTIAQDQAEILKMLNYWYSQANAKTKETFKQSIH